MKVILLQDVKGTGKRGDVLNVNDGFARNMLFPKNLARMASESSVKELNQQKARDTARREKEKQEAIALAERIAELQIIVAAKAGDKGKLFGSITNQELAEALATQHNIKIDKKKFAVEHIKSLGDLDVEIRVYPEVSATLKVSIVAQ